MGMRISNFGEYRDDGLSLFTYDYDDRVTGISYTGGSTNALGYNAFGSRVSATDSLGSRSFMRNGTGVTSPVLSDGAANYTPGISERRSGTTKHVSSDIKNTTQQLDAAQTICASKQYDAFGNITSQTGTWNGPFSYGGKFGYQSDSDTNLQLLGHRYYDSTTGRFLTRDTSKAGGNWYTYCGNNPVSYFDAEGLKKKLIIIIGDLLGPDIRGPATSLVGAVKEEYGDEYDIEIVKANSEDKVIDALSRADAVVMIGHGSPFIIPGKKPSVMNRKVLIKAYLRRSKKKKGKLDFIRMYTCQEFDPNTAEGRAYLGFYLRLAKRVYGHVGTCHLLRAADDLDGTGEWWESEDGDPLERRPALTLGGWPQ